MVVDEEVDEEVDKEVDEPGGRGGDDLGVCKHPLLDSQWYFHLVQ